MAPTNPVLLLRPAAPLRRAARGRGAAAHLPLPAPGAPLPRGGPAQGFASHLPPTEAGESHPRPPIHVPLFFDPLILHRSCEQSCAVDFLSEPACMWWMRVACCKSFWCVPKVVQCISLGSGALIGALGVGLSLPAEQEGEDRPCPSRVLWCAHYIGQLMTFTQTLTNKVIKIKEPCELCSTSNCRTFSDRKTQMPRNSGSVLRCLGTQVKAAHPPPIRINPYEFPCVY